MTSIALHLLAPLALALSGAPADTVSEEAPVGIAISSAKALTCAAEGPQVVDHALVLVRDGKIEAIGRQGEVEVPEGYDHVDLGDQWLMPGMIDLHCHVGGTFDINDGVFLANPGLRASVAVIPGNSSLKRGLASGVTSVLFIPGSGTNVGGQGILFKAGHDHFDDALIRQHGSLKIAQWGNPERWMIRPGKTFENYTIREIIRRGKGYAARRAAAADGSGPAAAFDPQLEIFDEIFNRDVPISVHPQIYQVVLATIDIIAKEMGANVFIDHGTGIVVGETAVVGDDCSILHQVTLGGSGTENTNRHPKIGNGVLIGAGACLLGNIRVGNSVQIGACSLVLEDLPDGCVAVGVPAKILGQSARKNPAGQMKQNIFVHVWGGADI